MSEDELKNHLDGKGSVSPRMVKCSWKQRLERAIGESNMSMRSISLACGSGPGYVHSVLTEGKTPTIDRFLELCEVLKVSPIYILHGIELDAQDQALIGVIRSDPRKKDALLTLFDLQ